MADIKALIGSSFANDPIEVIIVGDVRDIRTTCALALLAEMFQLGLIEKIREEQGRTYSLTSAAQSSEAFDDYGVFLGLIEAPPPALPTFLAHAQGIADSLAATPVSADELLRARRPLVERLHCNRAGNNWWLNTLDGLGSSAKVEPRIQGQISPIEGVTPAVLQGTAKQFLDRRAAYKLMALPEGGAAK